jgi:adenylate cyclase
MNSFIDGLKKRKISQWTVGYAAGAWVTFEIISQVSDTFGLAAVVGRVAFVLLAAGVPTILVLAWFHGEQGRQRVGAVEAVLLAGIVLVSTTAAVVVARTAAAEVAMEAPIDPLARLNAATASIAVLPFENLSGQEEDEYFSDGVSEELLNVLAQLPNLRVAARSSAWAYKGTSPNIPEVATALDVAYVLEGSIRRAGDEVRITAQLIDAQGFHAWSETYRRELTPSSVFEVEDEIVRQVSRELDLRLDRSDFLGRRPTEDAQAYELVLRGMGLLQSVREGDAREALTLFREATTRDPGYAAAHVGEGRAHLVLAAGSFIRPDEAYPPAMEAAERALELRPDWDAAVGLRASVRMAYEWQIEEAFVDAQRAVALNPNNPNNYLPYVNYWAWKGDVAKGCDALAAARRADPLSAAWPSYHATCLAWTGRFEDAIRAQKEAERLDPTAFFFDASVGNAYRALGRYDEAVELFDRAEYVLGRPSTSFAIFLAEVDSTHLAIARLEEIERRFDDGEHFRPEGVAVAWWVLGDQERAIEWWERGFRLNSSGMVMLRMFEQMLAGGNEIPELRELARRYGMPLPPS